jgi:hypothetical protein
MAAQDAAMIHVARSAGLCHLPASMDSFKTLLFSGRNAESLARSDVIGTRAACDSTQNKTREIQT